MVKPIWTEAETRKIKLFIGDKDVTELTGAITWSGSRQSVARKLEVSFLQLTNDYYAPKVPITCGEVVRFFVNDAEIFRGYVFNFEKSLDDALMRFTAFDGLFFLLKTRGSFSITQTTADKATSEIIKDTGIKTQGLPSGAIDGGIFEDVTLYDAIMTIYTQLARKTGKKYLAKMEADALKIVEVGAQEVASVLDAEHDLTGAKYSESIEDAVNHAIVKDKDGKQIGEARLTGSGDFKGIIKKETQSKDGNAEAELKAKKRAVSVEGLGLLSCVTGAGVHVKEPVTGLNGLFYIDEDTHNFNGGIHTMALTLLYEKAMDEKDGTSDSGDADASGEGASGEGATGGIAGSGYLWPIASVRYGNTYAGHYGSSSVKTPDRTARDIPAPTGTPILATTSGSVSFAGAGTGANWSYGNFVIINHDDGNRSIYAHMSRVTARSGQAVNRGAVIGYVGSTGNSTGPHLHFEVLKGGAMLSDAEWRSTYPDVKL